MLIAASTVKDTVSHVRRFVAGNLGGGLDHLVIFLDAPGAPDQDAVAQFLDSHPHVTCVRAGPGWWGGHRPAGLNERQCTNATVVSHLLADSRSSPRDPASPVSSASSASSGEPGVEWVFHIDGDEVVRLDPAALAEVPAALGAVRLAPREAVSRSTWEGEPTLFKRPLAEPELRLLHLLGAVSEPTNQAYFHGHLQGKIGVRPTTGTWLGLHKALTGSKGPAATHEDERLELFHYESYSGEEFVRKWGAMTASGPRASFRAGRASVADAVRTLIEKDLDPQVSRALLLEIFARTTQDDVETLLSLRLVLDTDPLAGAHVPVTLPDPTATRLHDGLKALRGADKSAYFRGISPTSSTGPPGKPPRRAGRGLLGRST